MSYPYHFSDPQYKELRKLFGSSQDNRGFTGCCRGGCGEGGLPPKLSDVMKNLWQLTCLPSLAVLWDDQKSLDELRICFTRMSCFGGFSWSIGYVPSYYWYYYQRFYCTVQRWTKFKYQSIWLDWLDRILCTVLCS